MSTRGRGFTHRQKPSSARFCPWCGVASLQRDDYLSEHTNHNNGKGVSFFCLTCGNGFNVQNSFRADLAIRYLRAEAKLRPPK